MTRLIERPRVYLRHMKGDEKMIYALIAAGIIVLVLCIHYGTKSCETESPTKSLTQDDMWDEMGLSGAISDGSDGSIPGDPWGTIYHDDD